MIKDDKTETIANILKTKNNNVKNNNKKNGNVRRKHYEI